MGRKRNTFFIKYIVYQTKMYKETIFMFLPQMKASVAKAFVICGKFRRNDLFHYKQTVLKGRYNVFPKTLYKLIYLIHGIIKKKKSIFKEEGPSGMSRS